jgi:adenosylcobinamide-GDP ribazoletransferase
MKSILLRELRGLCIAVGLLTRVPVPAITDTDGALRTRSLHWYPVAGLLIALPLALLALLALVLSTPPVLTAVIILTCWVALTGCLHLDGLADCADAWVGGMGDRERTLNIMKDPVSGPVGVVTLVLCLFLKLAAIDTILYLPLDSGWWLAPVFARTTSALAFITTPYVRPGGMGEGLARGSNSGVAVATGLTLLAATCLMPTLLWWAWLGSAAVLFMVWRRAMVKRLGGFTGDGTGALVELQETALLLITAVLAESLIGEPLIGELLIGRALAP